MQFIRPVFGPKDRISAVYKITIDGKWIYIGSSVNVKNRISRWVCSITLGKYFKNKNMRLVLKKESVVEFEVIEKVLDESIVRDTENHYLRDNKDNEFLLNRCPDATNNKNIKPYFGQTFKEKTKSTYVVPRKPIAQFDLNGNLIAKYESIADACRKLNTGEKNVRLYLKGKKGPFKKTIFKEISSDGSFVEPPKFKRKTPVYPQKRTGPSLRGGKNGMARAVGMFDKSGVFIKRFEAISDAARFINGAGQGISDVLGKRRKVYKGLIWKYCA